jgi:hypothetical protein
MHVGWTEHSLGVLDGIDGRGDHPISVRGGALMDFDEVQVAGDGELLTHGPYVHWVNKETRVINYTLTREPTAGLLRKGWRSAATTKEARAEVVRDFGEILEENAAGDNVYFRVKKKAA